jgi:hypothetical protein
MPIVRATGSDEPSKTDRIAAKTAAVKTREKLIDEAGEESFPASDPPSFMGGATTGAPKKKKKRKPEEPS